MKKVTDKANQLDLENISELKVLAREAYFWLNRLQNLDEPLILKAMIKTHPACENFIFKLGQALSKMST